MRARRRALPAEERQAAALAIARHTCTAPGWEQALRIALYLPADGEADPLPLVDSLRAAGKSIFLPVIRNDNSLGFAPWEADASLITNRFGIDEPTTRQRPATEMDIVLLPLVAWSVRGDRLGMGGGFYDRSLAQAGNVIKVGLAYEFQRVTRLASEAWDVALDFVATESALHNCQGDRAA